MMNIKQLDEQVSVSDQFSCEAMSELAASGVQVIVCNRPEGETEDQPSYAEMEKAAADAGLEFVAIPFARGRMTEAHCRQFAELLDGGRRIHAFCRTGNRSCNVWAGARLLAGTDGKKLLESAGGAGFDISGVLVSMESQ